MDAEVLVIGAGVAGLAAARDLQAAGVRALVLEARDRVGGRVLTDRSLGMPIDLGASWLSAASENPLARLAREAAPDLPLTDWNRADLHDAHGVPFSPEEIKALVRSWQEVARRLRACRQRSQAPEDLGAALERVLEAMRLPQRDEQALGWWGSMIIGMFQASPLRDLGLEEYGQEKDMPGDDRLVVDGFDRIVQRLAQGLEVRLGHVVTALSHSDSGVLAQTTKGTFRARQAIVTLPLGVLKEGIVRFEPALPSDKLGAIERLGMGLMDKIVLRFDEPFWPQEAHRLGLVTDHGLEFINLMPQTRTPVLVALTRAARAEAHERMSDAEVVEDAMAVLRRMYGRVSNPRAHLVTRWARDPFARGSYAHIPSSASREDMDTLAAPVGERLFFAGEAMSRDQWGTTQGAYLEGKRAAREAMTASAQASAR